MSESNGAAPAAAPVDNSTQSESINPSEQSKAKPEAQAPKGNKRSFDLKVNNEIKKLDLDLDNQDELTKYLQKAVAFDSKAQEAAQMRKQIEELGDYLSQAKGDKATLRRLIKDLGGDERELAQMIMEEELEKAKKSPEQLEREDLLKQLDNERNEKKVMKEEQARLQYERALSEEQGKIDDEITGALESNSIPKNPYFVKRLAEYALLAAEKGIDVPMKDLVPLVTRDVKEDIRQFMELSKDDFIEELLSRDRIANIRKKHLAESRQSAVAPKTDIVDTGSKQAPKKEERQKMKDFLWGK